LRNLRSSQETRLQREARFEANASVVAQVIYLVSEVIIIDGDDVGDAVPEAFDLIIEDLNPSTTAVQPLLLKRHRNVLRPDKWTEIIQHYMIYKNSASTIAKYDLLNGHSSHEYWITIYSKWRREALNVNFKLPVLACNISEHY